MQEFERLEEEWGEFISNPNVVACSSGTSALHLALETLEAENFDNSFWNYRQVIIPEFTMISCARAVVLAGMKPVFVDCNEHNLLIDCDKIQNVVTNGSIIMPVHIYGRQCNMLRVREIADRNNLRVVEDMSEIHGVNPHLDTDAACWSFYKNKIVAGEEGGAISFKNPQHVKTAKSLRSVGLDSEHTFLHQPRGTNARMSNAHASLILKSLANVEENLRKRRRVADWYNQYIPKELQMHRRDICWVYDLRLPAEKQKQVIESLNSSGISARYGFKPMSMQPEFEEKGYAQLTAYQMSREIIYLPIDPSISQEYVQSISEQLVDAL